MNKQFLSVATDAAKAAGKILEKYWGNLSKIEEKQYSGDLVTEADKESEKKIIEVIRASFPNHTLLAEESGLQTVEGAEYVWVIDPLDGTTNYTHQFPLVSISIALLYKGEPIVGVIYNPIINELFQSAKGLGATLNGVQIKVSDTSTLKKSLLSTGFSYDRRTKKDNNYQEFCHITHTSQGVRRGGSAAIDLAYVAAGRFEGFWEQGLKPWDIAAGIILVQEAGGKVTGYDGEKLILDSGKILATNGFIHETLSAELHRAKTENIRHF